MLYEVLAPGYHSPLTKTQIAELFRAGRLGRNLPCKQISRKEWRTVDELFPLLKYQSATISCDEQWQPVRQPAIDRTVALACVAVALAIPALWFYLASATRSTYRTPVSETGWPKTTSRPGPPVPTIPSQQPQQERWSQQPRQTNDTAENSIEIRPATPFVANTRTVDPAVQQKEAQARQRQEETARLQEERAKQEQKARGQDVIIPLDKYSAVNVGGVGVSVKIHDNDVTTFDVWINGEWHRAVPKQKGITHSRTDETFIYDSGRGRLYYVWEPSGKLNHCLLRVRED